MDSDNFDNELRELIENILNRLNFQVDPEIFDDLGYLRTAQFYIQIYQELFRKLSIHSENFFDSLEG